MNPLALPLVLVRWVGRALLAFALWLLFVQIVVRLVRRYWHFPAPPFIRHLLASPIRKAIHPPDEVIDHAGIGPGMTVLDLGCGPGTFTIPAARRVGDAGRVVAVDIEPKMIDSAAEAVRAEGLGNVEIRLAEAYDLPAANASVDVALLVTVLAEIPDRHRALLELRRVLKPEGLLAISEAVFDPDYPRQSTVIRWCEEAGFKLEERHSRLVWYLLTFRPRESPAG